MFFAESHSSNVGEFAGVYLFLAFAACFFSTAAIGQVSSMLMETERANLWQPNVFADNSSVSCDVAFHLAAYRHEVCLSSMDCLSEANWLAEPTSPSFPLPM